MLSLNHVNPMEIKLMMPCHPLAVAALTLLSATAACAQDASQKLQSRSLAATCAQCHGTDGRGAANSAVPSLAGMPKAYMITQLKAFKDGSRPATIMHQLSKGFTDEQVDRIATYFAAQPR
jgi:cytochrome c553